MTKSKQNKKEIVLLPPVGGCANVHLTFTSLPQIARAVGDINSPPLATDRCEKDSSCFLQLFPRRLMKLQQNTVCILISRTLKGADIPRAARMLLQKTTQLTQGLSLLHHLILWPLVPVSPKQMCFFSNYLMRLTLTFPNWLHLKQISKI